MSIGVNKPFIDFSEPGGDTGQADSESILPYADGEDVIEEVLNRPTEALRLRSEVVRNFLDDSIYLREADRHLVLGGPGEFTWPGPYPSESGIPTLSADVFLIPFLTPGNAGNSPPVGSTFGTITLLEVGSTPGIIVTSRRRNYQGGEKFNITVASGGATAVAISGTPPRNIAITAAAGTTLGAVIALINALVDEQATQCLTAALAGGAGSGDILAPTQAQQYITGNWDAEGHVLTPAAFASFFATAANVLVEGDTLAVWYAALVEDPSNPSPLGALGGRRQSIPENANTTVPAGSLFNSRVHPERLLNALPICKVINSELVLIDGTTLEPGDSGIGVGETSASGIEYSGGPTWADGTTNPATTVEAQLDKIVHDLADTGVDGAARLHALASGIFMTTGTLRAQLNQLDAAVNAVASNPAALGAWADATTIPASTLIAQLNRIVHDLGDASIDGPAKLHGTANGTYMAAGTLRAQLNELDTAIGGLASSKAPLTIAPRAIAAVRWNGSIYSFDWQIGCSAVAGVGTGEISVTLSNPCSSNTSGVAHVTPDATPPVLTVTAYMAKALLTGGGATVQVVLYDASGGLFDSSFYLVVFGA
jgi:hypothetical protein